MNKESITIVVAEDDADDRLLAQDALSECHLKEAVHFVEDGEELLEYLYHNGQYTDASQSPPPGLILLDLNMPKKDGREALKEIKNDPQLRRIPVVVFTTSKTDQDICHTYDLGANSFITKPASFAALVDIMQTLTQYWFETVKLPPAEVRGQYGFPPNPGAVL